MRMCMPAVRWCALVPLLMAFGCTPAREKLAKTLEQQFLPATISIGKGVIFLADDPDGGQSGHAKCVAKVWPDRMVAEEDDTVSWYLISECTPEVEVEISFTADDPIDPSTSKKEKVKKREKNKAIRPKVKKNVVGEEKYKTFPYAIKIDGTTAADPELIITR